MRGAKAESMDFEKFFLPQNSLKQGHGFSVLLYETLLLRLVRFNLMPCSVAAIGWQRRH
jgi:hypothetical protein